MLYRDVQYIIPFLVQLWMFVSPVIYSHRPASPKAPCASSSALNPMTGVIGGFRWALLRTSSSPAAATCGSPSAWWWCCFVGGLFYFKRMERVFADVV